LVRVRLSKQQRSDFRRIARLPAAWGHELDRLGASYAQTRWVAGLVRESLPETERRFRAIVELLQAEGGYREFCALLARWKGGEGPSVAKIRARPASERKRA
jgi:hypothetical protein